MKVIHLIVDATGDYEIAADDPLALAPRRRDGWWDQRTKLGRAATVVFRENQERRIKEALA